MTAAAGEPRLYDISPVVGPGIAVWPGDEPYRLEWTLRRSAGESVNLSRLTLSPHTGAHADAWLHCEEGAAGVEALPLEYFLGPVRLLHTPGDGPIDAARLAGLPWRGVERLLFRTRRGEPADPYAPPFAHLTAEAVDTLGAAGVILVGLDTPSMDEFHSTTLPAHHALLRHRIVNLECLDLSAAPAGDYELIALPLRLSGVEASPVRAILRSLPGTAG